MRIDLAVIEGNDEFLTAHKLRITRRPSINNPRRTSKIMSFEALIGTSARTAANECVPASTVPAMSSEENRQVYWVRTVGAPRPGDPRDGELHQFFGPLRDHFDLEPPDDGADAHYVRDTDTPPVEEEGRTIWTYRYQP